MKKKLDYNALSLHYKLKGNNHIEDISYVNCIKNLFGKYNDDSNKRNKVIKAFRLEINDSKRAEYLEENTYYDGDILVGDCDNCKKTTRFIAVDHYKLSFKELMTTFLNIIKLDINDIEVGNDHKLKNKNLAYKWLIYHDTRAVFRILCRSCNGHFGSYNY
jgi:hypothetical protein